MRRTYKYKVGDKVHLADDMPGGTADFPSTRNLVVSYVKKRQDGYDVCVKHPDTPDWESVTFDSYWIMPA